MYISGTCNFTDFKGTDKRQMPLLHHIVTFDNQETLR